jgi:hypothetical protein
MIGVKALFGESLAAVVVCAVFLLIAASLRRSLRSSRKDLTSLLGTVVFGGLALLICGNLAEKVRFVHDLRSLQTMDVRYLAVDSAEIDNSDQTAAWIRVLNNAEYFAPEHGGWTDTVPLKIVNRNGDSLALSVAAYSRTPGVVLISPKGRYAFSAVIPPHIQPTGR